MKAQLACQLQAHHQHVDHLHLLQNVRQRWLGGGGSPRLWLNVSQHLLDGRTQVLQVQKQRVDKALMS